MNHSISAPSGTIFKRGLSYWKVLDIKDNYTRCIKCTKNGKEFKEKGCFSSDYVNRLYKNGETFTSVSDERVSTDNKQRGIDLRRITYLEETIKTLVEELNTLNQKWKRKE